MARIRKTESFLFLLRDKTIKLTKAHLFAADKDTMTLTPFNVYLTPANPMPNDDDLFWLKSEKKFGELLHEEKLNSSDRTTDDWTIKIKALDFTKASNVLDDILLVFEYSI